MAFVEKTISLGTTDTIIYTCPVTQGGSIHGLVFSNITNVAQNISIKLFSQEAGTYQHITSSAFEISASTQFTWPKPININAGDKIIANCSTENAVVAIASIYISMTNTAPVAFRPRGAWSELASYSQNDITELDGSSYVATSSNTNSRPPSSSWMILSAKGDTGISFKGTWLSGDRYVKSDVVVSPVNHHLYIAKTSSIGRAPDSSLTEWQIFIENDSVSASLAASKNASDSAVVAKAQADGAAASSASAAYSASNALASKAAAESAAATAADSKTAALASQNSASVSESSANTSANSATASAFAAKNSESASKQFSDLAASSSLAAKQWAEEAYNVEVEAGKYSAKHWAMKAQATVTGTLVYQGGWSATTAYPSSPNKGDYYKVTASGTAGGTSYAVNDSIIFNGTDWDKIDSTDSVTSVANRTGAITLDSSDVGLGNVNNTSDMDKPVSIAQGQAIAGAASAVLTEATTRANDAKSSAIAASAPVSHVGSGGDAHALVVASGLAGFMSGADKAKLDGISLNANNYSLPIATSEILGGVKIGSGLSVDQFGILSAAGATNIGQGASSTTSLILTSSTGSGTTLEAAASTKAGVMTAADKVKLDGIATGATAYSHPATHSAGMIVQDANNRFVSDTEKATWNAKQPAGIYATGTGSATGVNTGDQTTITGNAGSATVLETARKINGVLFNGSSDITINAVDSTPRIASSLLATPNGVATLDNAGKVLASQLPSFVDDVLEYASLSEFPALGESAKIYVALNNNKTYRWSGSSYVYITSGAVDSVAGKTGVVTLADMGLGNVNNTSDAAKPVSTAQSAAITGAQTVAASDATTKANNAQANAIAASAPVAHVGSTGTAHGVATTAVSGFMSSSDKTKLDGIAAGATAYVHPSNHPASVITQDVNNRFVTDAEKTAWNAKVGTVKTINGQSIVGSGDLVLAASSTFATDITVNGHKFGRGANSDVFTNVAVGMQVLSSNTTGSQNTASGFNAMQSNTGGSDNTAYGCVALRYNTTGNRNTAYGSSALGANTTGNGNTAYGFSALSNSTTSSDNTAYGAAALNSNTSGANNAAIGSAALSQNTTGYNNTATGMQALNANNTGNNNTAYGAAALKSNTTGLNNTASGSEALRSNTTASNNTAFGNAALSANTTGENNVAFGTQALGFNVSANHNTAVGVSAMLLNTTGMRNTAIGRGALQYNTTGSDNIAIGSIFNANGSNPVFNVTTEDNRIVMGHTAITNAYVQVAWTVVSDARDKTNFAPIPHGLDFVKQLKPTAYQFRTERSSETTNGGVRYGFKAQDIADIEPEGVIIDASNPEKLYYNESNMVPVLVKALQELSAKNDALEARLKALEAK